MQVRTCYSFLCSVECHFDLLDKVCLPFSGLVPALGKLSSKDWGSMGTF